VSRAAQCVAPVLIVLAGVGVAGSGSYAAARSAPDESGALQISQAAIGRKLDGFAFRDSFGQPLRLADLRGRPLVVNMVYTACSTACPLVIQTLHQAVESAQEILDETSFAVVTIGFDAQNDTPERMRAFAREQGVDLPGWHFASGDQATIDRLAQQLGFVITPAAQGFDHIAQTTIVDRDGVINHQIYGGAFEVPVLVEPLKALVLGRTAAWLSVDGLIDRVKLFCTLYDPRSGRYRFDYSPFIAIAIGLACLSAVAVFLVREWRRPNDPAARA
jgi:protein SCO1/2